MQNFKPLAQPLLGKFRWGFLLLFFFFFFLLPHESKVNSQVWPVMGGWQYLHWYRQIAFVHDQIELSKTSTGQWPYPSIWTVFLPSRRPIVTWIGPIFVSLKIQLTSEWVKPATDLQFTEKISSPESTLMVIMWF